MTLATLLYISNKYSNRLTECGQDVANILAFHIECPVCLISSFYLDVLEVGKYHFTIFSLNSIQACSLNPLYAVHQHFTFDLIRS